MSHEFEIILNEYKTIKDLRERCIINIEKSTNTYLQFLGFIIAVN